MPAKSEAQRRFFGHLKSDPAERKRRGLSEEQVDEFLHTRGPLPATVKRPGLRAMVANAKKRRGG